MAVNKQIHHETMGLVYGTIAMEIEPYSGPFDDGSGDTEWRGLQGCISEDQEVTRPNLLDYVRLFKTIHIRLGFPDDPPDPNGPDQDPRVGRVGQHTDPDTSDTFSSPSLDYLGFFHDPSNTKQRRLRDCMSRLVGPLNRPRMGERRIVLIFQELPSKKILKYYFHPFKRIRGVQDIRIHAGNCLCVHEIDDQTAKDLRAVCVDESGRPCGRRVPLSDETDIFVYETGAEPKKGLAYLMKLFSIMKASSECTDPSPLVEEWAHVRQWVRQIRYGRDIQIRLDDSTPLHPIQQNLLLAWEAQDAGDIKAFSAAAAALELEYKTMVDKWVQTCQRPLVLCQEQMKVRGRGSGDQKWVIRSRSV
ncbi:hypothetical protein NA57DRAFT_57748 [Rhizodiscina lignyota]|uniref:Uncharacterized protein n=1 Tax=Rhizodiscina lignyota TaxID=1504668 RepID=A0A9P4ID41_9PEZI|nr:hypothetical protein NA57DRAFT_57748 [Rhizodiscina lignyota]